MVSKTGTLSGQLSQRGHTLLEMMLVCAILGLIAAVAIPSTQPIALQQLALTASEIADAFRFARAEAQRTNALHGVSVDESTETIRVFRLDEGPDPDVRVFDVRHPVTKQLYTVTLGAPPYAEIEVQSVGGAVIGTCTEPQHITFDASGVTRCSVPVSSRIENAQIELATGGATATVSVDSYTGRVTVL